MKNPIIHKIPLKALMACTLSVAKNDVRHFLYYIKVQDGYVASTDGHRAIMCEIDGLDKDFNIFINPSHIKDLHIGLKKAELNGDVEISIKSVDDETIVIMQYHNRTVKFVGENHGKFPDVRKVIPQDLNTVECMPLFNIRYLMDMQKVADIISWRKILNVEICPTGKNKPIIIKFPTSDLNITGVIMPMRGFANE